MKIKEFNKERFPLQIGLATFKMESIILYSTDPIGFVL